MTRTWVRIGMLVIALPQLVTGLWAVVDPEGWYEDFPGFGPSLVAADPPYNQHLATDAGAGFLATAVIVLLAAFWGRRREVTLALVGFTVFAIPHLAFHAANPSDNLSDAENAQSLAGLVLSAALPLVLLWGNRSPAPEEAEPGRAVDERATLG